MLLAARNILKSWLLVLALVGVFGLVGWLLDGVRGLSIFVFCALLLAAGAYWTFDRVVLGMLGARELPVGEAPLLHSTVERLAARAGIAKPRLYLVPDGLPIAAATGRGVRSSAVVVSTGCVAACTPAELVEFEGSPATESLFTINPFAERGLGALFVTHPPVAERVRRLRELDPTWRDRIHSEEAA